MGKVEELNFPARVITPNTTRNESEVTAGSGLHYRRVIVWYVVVHGTKAICVMLFATDVFAGGQFHDSGRSVIWRVKRVPTAVASKRHKSTFTPPSVISLKASDLLCRITDPRENVDARGLPFTRTGIDNFNCGAVRRGHTQSLRVA
jgi:hypothetical protein